MRISGSEVRFEFQHSPNLFFWRHQEQETSSKVLNQKWTRLLYFTLTVTFLPEAAPRGNINLASIIERLHWSKRGLSALQN